ncbi:MAG: C4-type zinc ribbon domain-containing protein [Dehalococcoidales bacterium]|nr:C4-type zinc ribbon domain-containing protein [Dehalococcoidales bacterium]
MNIAKQLYQLQEVDLKLETREQAMNRIVSQLGESERLITARNQVVVLRQQLEELVRQQHSIEGDVDDLTSKINKAREELYSGRIRNPKELANLQHEMDVMKASRSQLEDKALEIIDRAEHINNGLTTLKNELKAVETEWQSQQQQLSADLEQLKTVISELKNKQQMLTGEIETQTIEIYRSLRKQKGAAVAKVEQGMCRGCRISLPVSELQRTRSGSLVRCSSCGRILFLA